MALDKPAKRFLRQLDLRLASLYDFIRAHFEPEVETVQLLEFVDGLHGLIQRQLGKTQRFSYWKGINHKLKRVPTRKRSKPYIRYIG